MSPPGKKLVAHLVDDLAARDHRAERHVARVDPLRDAEDVGHDVPVLAREPLAGAAEAGHHLVEDQQDAVAVADLAHALEVAVGRHDDPFVPVTVSRMIAATVWAPSYSRISSRCGAPRADRARVGVPGRAAVGVRVEGAHDAGHAGLDGPAARVAGQRDGAVGGAVVGAVARDDLVAAR